MAEAQPAALRQELKRLVSIARGLRSHVGPRSFSFTLPQYVSITFSCLYSAATKRSSQDSLSSTY